MNFDDLQKTWSQQPSETRLTIRADALLTMVSRNQREFTTTIFWRDFREVGVALLLVVLFVRSGLRTHDWIDWMNAGACFGVGMFMLMDRLRQRRFLPAMSDSLNACLEQSLHQVRHQVWLLRNVLWWYLLPLMAPLLISIVCTSATWTSLAERMGLAGLVGFGIYRLNQRAVRVSLEPRQRELESLLASLNQDELD